MGQREEWLRLMLELAAENRDEYRRMRAKAWARLASDHPVKSSEQREIWSRNAS